MGDYILQNFSKGGRSNHEKPRINDRSWRGESLSVLYNNDNCNVITILDTIEDASSSSELVTKLNSLKLLNKFTLDRENSEYVRLVTTDYLGNRHYLKAQK